MKPKPQEWYDKLRKVNKTVDDCVEALRIVEDQTEHLLASLPQELHAKVSELAAINTEALRVRALVEVLRSGEVDSVTLFNDNPDPEVKDDQCAVGVCSGLTNYNERRFTGENMLHALENAVASLYAATLRL